MTLARQHIAKAQEKQRKKYNSRRRPTAFREGDLVMLHQPRVRSQPGDAKKLCLP